MSESKREAQRTFDALRGTETRTERVTVSLTPSEMDWLDALIATGMHGRSRTTCLRWMMLDAVRAALDACQIAVPDRIAAKLKASDGAAAAMLRKSNSGPLRHRGLPTPLADPGYLRHQLVQALQAFIFTVDYIGTDVLPMIPGWSWFDSAREIAAVLPINNPVRREWVDRVHADQERRRAEGREHDPQPCLHVHRKKYTAPGERVWICNDCDRVVEREEVSDG